MIGRLYSWRGEVWEVVRRWEGKGPRNVLIERLEAAEQLVGVTRYRRTGERIVRPFRGLRRVRA